MDQEIRHKKRAFAPIEYFSNLFYQRGKRMSKRKSIRAMMEIENLRKSYLIDRKIYLMGLLYPDGIKTSYLGDDLDASCIHGGRSKAFEDILPEIMEIQTQINGCNKELEILERLKEQIFEQIQYIEPMKEKVKYLREYVGLSLREISDVLGYSYDYIKELSAIVSRENPPITPLTE